MLALYGIRSHAGILAGGYNIVGVDEIAGVYYLKAKCKRKFRNLSENLVDLSKITKEADIR